jgi:hypothetical protein
LFQLKGQKSIVETLKANGKMSRLHTNLEAGYNSWTRTYDNP